MGMFYGWIPPRSCKQPKRTFAFRLLTPARNLRMEEYQAMKERCPSVGNGIGNASVNSVMDPTSLDKEQPEIRDAIVAKSKRLGSYYNKGPIQYLSDETDLKTVGRKV